MLFNVINEKGLADNNSAPFTQSYAEKKGTGGGLFGAAAKSLFEGVKEYWARDARQRPACHVSVERDERRADRQF
jgi:hypothetical protein